MLQMSTADSSCEMLRAAAKVKWVTRAGMPKLFESLKVGDEALRAHLGSPSKGSLGRLSSCDGSNGGSPPPGSVLTPGAPRITFHRRGNVASGPDASFNKAPLPLSIPPLQMNRALGLPPPERTLHSSEAYRGDPASSAVPALALLLLGQSPLCDVLR